MGDWIRGLEGAFFEKALNLLEVNIYITDAATSRIVYMNDTMKRTFGLEKP